MITKTITVDIFKYRFITYIVNNKEEYDDLDIENKFDYDDTDWSFYHRERALVIKTDWFTIWTLAHEITHLAFHIQEARWIPIRIENDEVTAYLVEYLMNKLNKLI